MRNYHARLAKLEAAIIPPPPLHIVIEWVDDWRGTSMPPIATVAPGLLERLRDDQLESIVTATGGDVAGMYAADDAAHPPPPPLASPSPGALNIALPGDPPKEVPWSFETARWMYHEPPAGPNLRKMRAMARRARIR